MSRFDGIAAEAIRKAEQVKCPLGEFAEGLAEIIDAVTDRYNEVTGELRESEA